MPFGIGWPELLIVLVIVMVVFGAKRVPEIGRALGKGIREFKTSVEAKDEEPQADAEEKPKATSKKS
ncbi:MAG: twin-arginine translocase TatA/TatE family subunit [Dehalococcoidia bacterium]